MPWEKQFKRDEVLEKAMHAFWQHGYDGTSMKDLIACTGLNPGSIYASFGDKKNLFCQALEHYEAQSRDKFADFAANHSPRDAILAVFQNIADDTENGPEGSSCFLVNSVVDAGPKDDKIKQLTETGLSEFENFLKNMILAGQDSGDIDPDISPTNTARLLMGLVIGGRILARGHLDRVALEDFVRQADQILG
jgi:TetR/AcrR family transcriptional repressor of nem operon